MTFFLKLVSRRDRVATRPITAVLQESAACCDLVPVALYARDDTMPSERRKRMFPPLPGRNGSRPLSAALRHRRRQERLAMFIQPVTRKSCKVEGFTVRQL
jgi:hypothetical protein